MPRASTMRNEKGQFIKGHGRSCKPFLNVIPISLKKEIRVYKADIIADLGGESEITAGKLLLIDNALHIYQIIRVIEAAVNKQGPMRGGKLTFNLTENYLKYCTAFRLALQAIGLERGKARRKSPEELRKLLEG